jgi:aqualysin 1
MYKVFGLVLSIVLVACGQVHRGSDNGSETAAYIVAYLEDAATVQSLQRLQQGAGQVSVQRLQTLGLEKVKVNRVYTAVLSGVAVELSKAQLEALQANPLVAWVEPDQKVSLTTTQQDATWGLDRIDQRSRGLNKQYNYTNTGRGVRAYVIDSGILPTHAEFGTRAKVGADFINDGRAGIDCNGHGTHVAGTVGGATYGVAKEVQLIGVRVFGCGSTTELSTLIAGMDWVRLNAVKPAVVNMSFEADVSPALDAAADSLEKAGIVTVIAAGNGNIDACNKSPARVPSAITVGATNLFHERRASSNFGTCLDIFAPGSAIASAWIGSNTATNEIGGTSMAAPHVAGVAALYLQTNRKALPVAVRDAIVNNSTPSVLKLIGTGSPNKYLYTNY